MTQPIPYRSPDMPLDFPNRKGGLITFGIILICMGALSGCVMIAAPLGIYFQQTMPRVASTQPSGATIVHSSNFQIRTALSTVLMCAGITTGLIWTGIGSIRLQRWVRPIVMVFSMIGLVTGILAMAAMGIALPAMRQSMQTAAPPGSTPIPAAATYGLAIFAMAFLFVIYILIPGIFFWFYRSENVRLTLEHYDPTQRWTDRCPISVLGMSIALAIFSASTLMGLASMAVPMFGVIFTGPIAVIILLAIAALYAIAAVLVYRQRILGWNLAVGIIVLFALSTLINTLRIDMAEWSRTLEMPPDQGEILQNNPSTRYIGTTGILTIVICAAYALRIRRHFSAAGNTAIANTQ